MANAVIAIKTADGSRFPILDRNDRGRKRVVLTTSRDNQERVQIDMYQGDRDDLANAEYIGSLVIDEIKPASAGSLEFSLVVGIDEGGELQARAQNLSNGDIQSLSIRLDRVDESAPEASAEAGSEELPDFSFDDEESFDLETELEEPPVFDPDESSDESVFDGPEPDDLAFELPDEDVSEFEEARTPADTGDGGNAFTAASGSHGEEAVRTGAGEDEPVRPRGETEDFSFDEFDTPYEDERVDPDATTDASVGEPEELAGEPDSRVAPAAGPSSIYFVAYMLLGLAILAGLVYLIYGAFQAEPVPPLESAAGIRLASLPVPFIGAHWAVRKPATLFRRVVRHFRGGHIAD